MSEDKNVISKGLNNKINLVSIRPVQLLFYTTFELLYKIDLASSNRFCQVYYANPNVSEI